MHSSRSASPTSGSSEKVRSFRRHSEQRRGPWAELRAGSARNLREAILCLCDLREGSLHPETELMAGKYFEELKVGDVVQHQPGRTVTETDNLLFTTPPVSISSTKTALLYM